MNCDYGKATLDDYFDQALDTSQQTLLLAHCRHCAECRAAVDAHTQYLLMLKTFRLASPGAAPVRPQHADAATPCAHPRTQRARTLQPWLLRSAAAIAALAIGIGWHYGRDLVSNEGADPGDDMWSKVNIVIHVPAMLDDARLTVSLPQGIYVPGHEGIHTLAWNADFAEGTNALELPIRVDSAAFDRSAPQYLDATLEYRGASKRFEFLVDLDEAVAGTF